MRLCVKTNEVKAPNSKAQTGAPMLMKLMPDTVVIKVTKAASRCAGAASAALRLALIVFKSASPAMVTTRAFGAMTNRLITAAPIRPTMQ